MDQRLVTDLEAAIADVGALLVRAQKYRAGDTAAAVLRRALALGDSVRRLHRRGALNATAVAEHLARARALGAELQAFLVQVRDGSIYHAAVAAHTAGDQDALARTLPSIFAGLAPAARPRTLFYPVAWRHRGRIRPPADLAGVIADLATQGILAEGDDLTPGVDPLLPAIMLWEETDPDQPLALELSADTLPPGYQLEPTGAHLVYVARLRVPATVRVATALDPDGGDDVPIDYLAYRNALVTNLLAAGVAVR